jgi:hypothetical protein
MYYKTSARIALILLSGAFITGCDNTKKILGLERQNPDEFNVMQPAPLSMPPRFDELPTPRPGVQRPQEQSPQERARRAVTGEKVSSTLKDAQDSAEDALLKRAGADATESDIRHTINKEAQAESSNEGSFVHKIVGIKKKKSGKTIDPQEEHKRIYGEDHPSSKVGASSKTEE